MIKKKGEISINTIVLIVIAIVVLVVLILGFTVGWQSFWSKVRGYSSSDDVDNAVLACQHSADVSAQHDYCCSVREVVFVSGEDAKRVTCDSDSRLRAKDLSFNCRDIKTICKESICDSMTEEDLDYGAFIGIEESKCDIKNEELISELESKELIEKMGGLDNLVVDISDGRLFDKDGEVLSGNKICCLVGVDKCVGSVGEFELSIKDKSVCQGNDNRMFENVDTDIYGKKIMLPEICCGTKSPPSPPEI